MSQFLAVRTRTVIDQAFVAAIPTIAAIPEVVEDLTESPPIAGQPAVPAIPGVKEVPEISHDEVFRCYLEDNPAQVAKHLADPQRNDLTYYAINFDDDLNPSFSEVREKARKKAPAKELITIEDADGNEVGSAEI